MQKESSDYRQIIIARKDLDMSSGKLAAQVSHASMAFLSTMISRNSFKNEHGEYECHMIIDKELYEKWIRGIFTKIILEAKNKKHLEKAINIANELGLQEGVDYFVIRDACLTELEPEEYDKDSIGRTITCIGFRPMHKDNTYEISKKFQLFKQ